MGSNYHVVTASYNPPQTFDRKLSVNLSRRLARAIHGTDRQGNSVLRFSHKLPVQAWHGDHAAPAQGADKAEGRVSTTGNRKYAPAAEPVSARRRASHQPGRHCKPQ